MSRLPHQSADATFLGKLSPDARRYLEAQQQGATSGPELETPTSPSSAPAPASSSTERPRAPTPRNREHDRYQRDLRWLDRRRRELGERDGVPADFAVITRDVWRGSQSWMGSRRACWLELCRTKNRAAVGALRAAAFADGARGWSSSYAHRVLVLGLSLLALSRPSKRKGRFRYVLDGIPREALCALLRDPHSGHTPSTSALRGHHRSWGNIDNGQIGYLDALEAAGFLTRLQRRRPPEPPSCNQYWIVGHSAYLFGDALAESLRRIEQADDIVRPLSRGSPSPHDN